MKAQLLNVNPTIGYIDRFLDEDDFMTLKADLRTVKAKPAKVLNDSGSEASTQRIANSCRIPRGRFDSVDKITKRIADFFNLEAEYCELPVLIQYEQGGEYKPHFDASSSGTMPSQMLSDKRGNQRIFTGILYLNGGFDGGSTKFPRLNLDIQPKARRLAFWQNTQTGSYLPHPLSLHQGCPGNPPEI